MQTETAEKQIFFERSHFRLPFFSFYFPVFFIFCTLLSHPGQAQEVPMPLHVIGHRGAAGLAPENTLAGFKKAIALGVDALELDVHLTKDGHVVVHHDARLNTVLTQDEKGRWLQGKTPAIKDLTYEDLQKYTVGQIDCRAAYAQKYPEQESFDLERIPLLKDVIDLAHLTQTPLYIELKTDPDRLSEDFEACSDPEDLTKAALKVIQECGAESRVFLMSLDWRGPLHAQKQHADLRTCFVTAEDKLHRDKVHPSPWLAGFQVADFKGSVPQMIKAAGGQGWNVFHQNLTREDVLEAHSLGLKVVVWTPDTEEDLKKMIDLGVDGITTNRPDRLLRLLGRL